MFTKLKRAISGWGPSSDGDRPKSPQPKPSSGRQFNSMTKRDLKNSNSFRNSLPARFRTSIYKDPSSSSSEALPLPLAQPIPATLPSEDLPRHDGPNREKTLPHIPTDSTDNGVSVPAKASLERAQTDPNTASPPQKLFIRRTSSFHSQQSQQSQRQSSESSREETTPEEDIIIFSSTPPVTFARSSSVKIPRPGARPTSVHKGSPEHGSSVAVNQEAPVVQWPRGGASSGANRSQEHFLRSHRRTSTSSDASLKELQSQMATTPPVSSALRQDILQRPSLDRQHSRSGPGSGSATTLGVSPIIASEAVVGPRPSSLVHHRNASDASVESLAQESTVPGNANVSCSMTHSATAIQDPNIPVASSAGQPSVQPALDVPHLPPPADTKKITVNTPKSVGTSNDGPPALSAAVTRQLAAGTQMLKISAKKQHSRLFKLDLEQGRILWESRKFGRINVEQIKELRKGKAARMYREQLRVKPEHEERWLTIIYSAMGKYKALHLVAPTKDTYHDWINAVERMWSVKREVAEGLPQLQRKTNQWLKEHWMDADKNVDSRLGYEEVVKLCHRLNINFSRKEIKLRFDQADEKKQGFLDFADFTHFVKLLKERKEILALFTRATKSDSMSLAEFVHFMQNTQKTDFDEDHIKEIYGKHLDKTVEKFTVDSLTSFLLSADNSVVAPIHAQVHQDMSQTLSNYFISSSHNTYLLGHQLTGISSIEGYIRALQSGCRCVELDCWDGPDGQPVIYHGRTLTSKILFRDVIEAISTYAFVNSPYPLILSLEIHCDLDQQTIMANTMRSKLGSWLVVAPLDLDSGVLPSPEDLKFKILIKSKVLPPDAQSQEYSTDTESESERESESDSDGMKQPKQKPKTKKKIRIAQALSDITIYCQSRHFLGFTHDGCSPFKIISFSERVSLRLCKQSLQDYTNLNKSHLTRVYPAGFRINSTNYDPHHHWAAGAQVVALNYQSHDRGMQMNSAMYTMNGHCGYVLKPEALRLGADETCNHSKAVAFTKSYPLDITLEIISAQQLPRPNEAQTGDVIDPICEVEMLVPGQSAVKYKTRHVNDNGFNPVWQESFKFRVDYEHHELVFFRFVVEDEDLKFSDLIASYCISLASLQEGYRHIQLHDPSGDPYLYSTLFVRVSIQPVVGSQPSFHMPSLASKEIVTTPPLAQPAVEPSQLVKEPSRPPGLELPQPIVEPSPFVESTTEASLDKTLSTATSDETLTHKVAAPLQAQKSIPILLEDLPPLPPTPPPK